MPRCKKKRCCRCLDGEILYKPVSFPCKELNETSILLDEFEAMRLCDLEGLDQTAAGDKMGVSRGTVQRLLVGGRQKLIAALMNNEVIHIQNSSNQISEEES